MLLGPTNFSHKMWNTQTVLEDVGVGINKVWSLEMSSSGSGWKKVAWCLDGTNRTLALHKITVIFWPTEQESSWDLLSSGISLRSVDWYLVTDVSGHPIGVLKIWPISYPETSANNYQSMPPNNTSEDRRSHLQCGGSLKSRKILSPAERHCFVQLTHLLPAI